MRAAVYYLFLPSNAHVELFSQIPFFAFSFASFAKKHYICTVKTAIFGHHFSQECEILK
jgi:hypothetical protein